MLCFVLLDYFSAQNTKKCVDELIGKTIGDEISIVVVDNSTNKENSDELRNAFGGALNTNYQNLDKLETFKYRNVGMCLCVAQENYGYSKGNNLGAIIAKRAFSADYVCFSNNDISIINDYLDLSIIENCFDSHDKVGVIGPKIINEQGENVSPYKRPVYILRWIIQPFLYPFDRVFRKVLFDDVIRKDEEGIVYRVQGSFMFCKLDAFYKVGGFDSRTFLFAEEAILAERMAKAGLMTYYMPEILIMHRGNELIGNHYSNIARIRLRYQSEELYFYCYLKTQGKLIAMGRIMTSFMFAKMRFVEKVRKCFKTKK